MEDKKIRLQKETPLAVLTINRPGKRNAIDPETAALLNSAVDEVAADDRIRAVILTGEGSAFSAGTDLDALGGYLNPEGSPNWSKGVLTSHSTGIITLVLKMRDLRKPLIAAINGPAIGAGLSLALACDIRIASENASFAMMQVKRCMIPDTAATYTLPRVVSIGKAMKLAMTGDIIDARQAERWGLVDEVVPHDQLMTASRELALRIARNSPLAVGLTKAALHKAAEEPDITAQLDYESFLLQLLFTSQDFKEAMTSYREKRQPEFKGR